MERQWQATTRGGHHVRNIHRVPFADGKYDLHGEVCLNGDGKTPPSEDPRDWQGECWAEDGRYYDGPESDLDLMEVQDGE
jgi:hypothetical protein